jgi:Tol biopolymer transport system component
VFWALGRLVPALSWSPDGAWLALGELLSADEPARVVRVSLDTAETQPLTSPPEQGQGDFYPAFSPGGDLLAFARSAAWGLGGWDVWVQETNGGELRRLTFGSYSGVRALEWTPDGTEILYTTFAAGAPSIHRVALAGGDPVPVLGLGAGFPSVRGTVMVHLRVTSPPEDIWRAPGRLGLGDEEGPRRLIASTQDDLQPAYSPDGDRIAFVSRRSGAPSIWVCDNDGADPVQLTHFDAATGTPSWSPDGRQILFDSILGGDWNLYVVDAEGGTPRRITASDADDSPGSWSRDGRFIYFRSNRSGTWQIWKMPSEGGEAVQITRGGGGVPMESWDGRDLYYAWPEWDPAIWRMPVEGGEETEVLPGPVTSHVAWTVSRNGLYYATQGRGGPYSIQYLDFDSGQVTELLRREEPRFRFSLTVSPDERWILFTQPSGPLTSELVLVENFR